MSLPVCPKCGSGSVVPYQFSAGQNVCMNWHCRYVGQVAEFHPETTATSLKVYPPPRGNKHRDRVEPDADEKRLPRRPYWLDD